MSNSKKPNDDLFVIMSAYNESQELRVGVEKIQKLGFKNIIVIDDGSKDDTYDVMMSLKGIYALSHKINRGQGAGLQTGITFALKQGAKYIVVLDADGQHSAEEIDRLVAPVINGECDIAIGTRFRGDTSKSNVPLIKKIFLRFGIFTLWFLFGLYLTDSQNGFKAMNAKAAKSMKFMFDKYEYCSEIVDIIKINKLKVLEVPVTVIYTEHSLADGQKLSNSVMIIWHMFWYKLNKILFK